MTETVLAEWSQTFGNTSGSNDRPGMIAGQAITPADMQVVDTGDPAHVLIRETGRHGVRREFLANRRRTLNNLDRLKNRSLPYYLIASDTLTPEQLIQGHAGNPGIAIGDANWSEDVLDLTDETTTHRVRSVSPADNPSIVYVLSEGRGRPRVFTGSTEAFAAVPPLRFEEVLTQVRR